MAASDNTLNNGSGLGPEAVWPQNCQYFDPRTMDISRALDLNANDTKYAPSNEAVQCITFGPDSPQEHVVLPDPSVISQIRSASCLPESRATVVFLGQLRCYSVTGSTVKLSVDSATWQRLLTTLELPPNVVELLHDNNGGAWQHVSYSSDCSAAEHSPRAYHVCFKRAESEMMYGRYDFQSKRSLVLIMGSDLREEKERLLSQFAGQRDFSLPHVVLAVLGTWLHKVEQARWSLDLAIFQLEAGAESCQVTRQVQPPPPNQLYSFRADIADAQIYMRTIARHSACMGTLLETFTHSVTTFYQLEYSPACGVLLIAQEQILDRVAQLQSQQRCQAAQAHDLSWRIDTQWSVLVALKSKHDSEVLIAMAQDTRADSVLMKQMAAISVVFLPATFLATFFSMMFFQVDDIGELNVNRNIWVYFIFTTGLSMCVWLYFRFGKPWKLLAGCSADRYIRRWELPLVSKTKESV